MSTKANQHTRRKRDNIRIHNHLTLSKTGYIPSGTNYAVNIKIAKRG